MSDRLQPRMCEYPVQAPIVPRAMPELVLRLADQEAGNANCLRDVGSVSMGPRSPTCGDEVRSEAIGRRPQQTLAPSPVEQNR